MRKYTTKIERVYHANYDYLVHICNLEGDKIWNQTSCETLSYRTDYPVEFIESLTEEKVVKDARKIGVSLNELYKMNLVTIY